MRHRRPRFRSLFFGAAILAAAGSAPAGTREQDLEKRLRGWLSTQFERAFVGVRDVNGRLADVVVTVVPSERDARVFDQTDADKLVRELRAAVLHDEPDVDDFRSGSQFSILKPGQIVVAGAGPELEREVGRVAWQVIQEVTRQGLSLQYLSAEAFAGSQVALEVQARGVGLGEVGRRAARDRLDVAIRDRVMKRHADSFAYLPESSMVEVWDATRPVDGRGSLPIANEEEPWFRRAVVDERVEDAPAPEGGPAGPPPAALPEGTWLPPPEGHVVVSERTLETLVSPMDPGETAHRQPDGQWAPDLMLGPDPGEVAAVLPHRAATDLPPSQLKKAPRRPAEPEPGALARRLRELRARRPWTPAMPPAPPVPADQDTAREPPRKYPAAPFGIGPGVASCELFVLFDTSKYAVKSEEVARLRAFLEEVPPERIRGVHIMGHADSRQPHSRNRWLGWKRAEAVRDFLVAEGVKGLRIETTSYGETSPKDTNRSDEGRSRNRRAHLQITFADDRRPMHSDRSPHWRDRRSMPMPPRRDGRGLRRPYDPHFAQGRSYKWNSDGE